MTSFAPPPLRARRLGPRSAHQRAAGPRYPTQWSQRTARAPAVSDALRWLEANFPRRCRSGCASPRSPAQSTHEQQRAAYVAGQMRAEGLEVSTDSIGNVTGRRRGAAAGPSSSSPRTWTPCTRWTPT